MRRQTAAAAGAIAIVVAVVGMILAFGVISLPDYPSLGESPDAGIPGEVAFVRIDGERSCIHTVRAGGGEARRILCNDEAGTYGFANEGPGSLAWTPEGRLMVSSATPTGSVILVIDTAGSEVVERIDAQQRRGIGSPYPQHEFYELEMRRAEREDGARLLWGADDDEAYVSVSIGTGTRELVLAPGPSDYSFVHAQWSPDGRFVLVQDSSDRLLVLRPEGDAEPQLLADDATSAAWFVPGNTNHTIPVERVRAGT